jgi:signal transduction histidine kinase
VCSSTLKRRDTIQYDTLKQERERTARQWLIEGLGLGLSISHEVIRQHGGRIWLTSESGRGSTFSPRSLEQAYFL